jgi:hypothetical protein
MSFFRIPDLGSLIHIFESFVTIFGYNFLILAKFFSSTLKKLNNLQFCETCGYKKGMTSNFFSPLSFFAVFGSEIRDPGWIKIRIRNKHPGSTTLRSTTLFSKL